MRLEFVIPGDLAAATGGYGYDRRIIQGLEALGWSVTVHSLDASFPQPTAAALAQAEQVFAGLPDGALVLVDGLAGGAMPQVLLRQAARLRLFGLVHHPLAAENGLDPKLAAHLKRSEQLGLSVLRHIIVTSGATRELLPDYGVARERITVIEPGTDRGPLAQPRADGILKLLCVATLIPRKGHDLLFEALGTLKAAQWQLTCAGSSTLSPATAQGLCTQLTRLGIDGRVTLLGETDPAAVTQLYQSADVFVLPSRFEGYGMAVAEALGHGVPVISTRVGAIAELVGPDAGLVVEPDDLAGLQQALAQVLHHPAMLATLRTGAVAARARLQGWEQAASAMARTLTAHGAGR